MEKLKGVIMGINIHVFTMYGFKTDWDDDFYESYDEVEEYLYDKYKKREDFPKDSQIESVVDSMSGESFAFGHILYDSGDFRWCENMNYFQELDVSENNLKKIKIEYEEKFKKLYPKHFHLIENKEWKVFNLIHYS